ncbi:predicted protein, partial [Nematostella vectensis]
AVVDLGFIIDSSGSIEFYGKGNFKKVLDFVGGIVKEFEVSKQGTHVGIIRYDHKAEILKPFGQVTDKQGVLDKISKITFTGGGTKTGQALTLAMDGLYQIDNRKEVPDVLIVLTDGASKDSVVDPANKLKNSGVTVFAVGIGKEFKEDELNLIA